MNSGWWVTQKRRKGWVLRRGLGGRAWLSQIEDPQEQQEEAENRGDHKKEGSKGVEPREAEVAVDNLDRLQLGLNGQRLSGTDERIVFRKVLAFSILSIEQEEGVRMLGADVVAEVGPVQRFTVHFAQNVSPGNLNDGYARDGVFLLAHAAARLRRGIVDPSMIRIVDHEQRISVGERTLPGVSKARITVEEDLIDGSLKKENGATPAEAHEGKRARSDNCEPARAANFEEGGR
jgi:hypothetical protein